MANRVTIDVEAKFNDRASSGIDKVQKKVDKLNKTTVKPKVDADDKASSKLSKIMGAAKSFGSKAFKGTVDIADKATHKIEKVMGAAKNFARKAISVPIKVIDKASSVLSGIKNKIFSLETAFKALVAGFAAKKIVLDPINLADAYSGAKIGFSTLLGDTAGQEMMNKIDQFAKETPFKTSGVISNVQKMMAYGWDVDRVIDDMRTIGDAAAATGKGDEGLTSIVYALSEIRSKGKLSTQELNQLASAGIKAKAYLAEGLGYGTSDEGMAALAKDLEGGAIGANQAIELILSGMKEFEGMMDRTANETVEGLKSQLEDTFEINIFRRWGQGLQDGAKRGLGSIVELLDGADDALSNLGDTLYDLGSKVSGFLADKLEETVGRITEITGTYEFKTASLAEKMKMLWQGVIADPISEWWNTKGHALAMDKAADFGTWLGNGLTNGIEAVSNGILYMLGLDTSKASSEGDTIGSSFWDAFTDAFDSGRVTDAIVSAVEGVWAKIPTWAKVLLVGYAGGKAISGIGNVVSGISNIAGGISTFLGSAGAGTGLLGFGSNAAISLGAGNLAGGASLGAGALSAIGLGATAGGIAAGASAVKGGYDLYKSYKAYKAGDKTEAKASGASGGMALGGVAAGAAAGAAIGSIIPGLGTAVGALVGAGIGGIAGWWSGDKVAKNIRKNAAELESAKYKTEEMQEAVKNLDATQEELNKAWEKELYTDMVERFGDIKLSAAEIESIAKRITFGDKLKDVEQFSSSIKNATASLESMENAQDGLKKWNWKASLGISLSDDDYKSYKESIDSYINSAKSYVENKHYAFTAAVNILFEPESEMGKSITEGGNNFFGGIQEQLASAQEELENAWSKVMEDGKISIDDTVTIMLNGTEVELNEQQAIEQLTNQITEITNKIADAEQEVRLGMLQFKFSDISYDSWNDLMEQLKNELSTGKQTNEEATAEVLLGLQLQLNEASTEEEKQKIKEQIDATYGQLEIENVELEANISNIAFSTMGNAFSADLHTTAEDAAAKLKSALETSLKDGVNPIEWTTADAEKYLNTKGLSDQAAANISTFLAGMQELFPETYKAEVNVEVNPKPQLSAGAGTILDDTLGTLNTTNKTVTPNVTVSPNMIDQTPEWNPTVRNKFASPSLYINGSLQDNTPKWNPAVQDKTKNPVLRVNSSLIDNTPAWNPYIADKTISPGLTITPRVYWQSQSIKVTSVAGHADGGYVSKPEISWLGEEGYPEMVIPFAPHRRQRALSLYEQTGRMLGVGEHASGGMVGGGSAPVISSGSGSGERLEVSVGDINISVNSNGGSLAENLDEQKEAIAEKVSEILYRAFSSKFNNTPVRA